MPKTRAQIVAALGAIAISDMGDMDDMDRQSATLADAADLLSQTCATCQHFRHGEPGWEHCAGHVDVDGRRTTLSVPSNGTGSCWKWTAQASA